MAATTGSTSIMSAIFFRNALQGVVWYREFNESHLLLILTDYHDVRPCRCGEDQVGDSGGWILAGS